MDNFNNNQELPLFSKNTKIAISVFITIIVIAIVIILYLKSKSDSEAKAALAKSDSEAKAALAKSDSEAKAALAKSELERSLNSLENNPLNPRGGLFGSGYSQYLDLKIDKTFSEVTGNCYPKCANDPQCAGFGYNVSNRYDGRRNGNCWFMRGPVKFVDGPPKNNGILGAVNWIKK
jgi:hypothetical protein